MYSSGPAHRSGLLALALLAANGCGSPPAADLPTGDTSWIAPGTIVHEMDLPSRGAGEIVVEEVLSFGGEPDATEAYRFYYALELAVDDRGRIFVYDSGNRRIQVFDPAGAFVRTIGGSTGQGPGEFGRAGRITVTGSQVVYIRSNSGMSTWNLEGDLEWSGWVQPSPYIWRLEGSPSGGLVASYTTRVGAPGSDVTRLRAVARLSYSGEELVRFAELPDPGLVMVTRSSGEAAQGRSTGIPHGESAFAVSRTSQVLLSHPTEYEILAVNMDGRQQWAVRVQDARAPISEVRKREALASVREDIPDATADEITWPDGFPALSIVGKSLRNYGHGYPVRVDGAGRVFVFPFVPDELARGERRPVDVYSPRGELIFSGSMSSISWMAAFGDLVYGLELADNGEQQVVVYRVSLPGEDQ